MRGVSPDGAHYYPAFPYTSYARMKPEDVADLFAFMKTLPPVAGRTEGHSLGFPYSIRRGIGLWKRLYLRDTPVIALPEGTPAPVLAGRYLVEGPGHCGECHTPRYFTGGAKKDQWLAGATAAEGKGVVPNITGGEGGIGSWSEADIVNFLETGFTPDFDSVGGAMAAVQRNMAMLSAEDRQAIAAYLKAVPPHPNGYPAKAARAARVGGFSRQGARLTRPALRSGHPLPGGRGGREPVAVEARTWVYCAPALPAAFRAKA